MELVYNGAIKNEELSRVPYNDVGNCVRKDFLMTGWFLKKGNGTLLMNYNVMNQSYSPALTSLSSYLLQLIQNHGCSFPSPTPTSLQSSRRQLGTADLYFKR